LDLTFYLDAASASAETEIRHMLMLDISKLADRMGIPLGDTIPPVAKEEAA